jgi:DNA-binding XRE family transcriptional regulator
MKTNQAQLRASVIMRVQKGELTATEGARLLGVSRKTYYQWEKRALSGLLTGVSEQEPGRPSNQIDPEKEALQRKVVQLEAALHQAKEVEAVRMVLLDIAKIRDRKERSKKNSKRSQKSSA